MARFKVNDNIELLRRRDVMRKGKVVKGPFEMEGVDHYQVEWTWVNHEDWAPTIGKIDLISDITTEKYHYQLSN